MLQAVGMSADYGAQMKQRAAQAYYETTSPAPVAGPSGLGLNERLGMIREALTQLEGVTTDTALRLGCANDKVGAMPGNAVSSSAASTLTDIEYSIRRLADDLQRIRSFAG